MVQNEQYIDYFETGVTSCRSLEICYNKEKSFPMKTIASSKHRLMLVLIFSFVIILVIQNPAIQSTYQQILLKKQESVEKSKEYLKNVRNEIRQGLWYIKNHPYFRG